jgi:hypothetical protein
VLGIDHKYYAQVTLKLDLVDNLVIEHHGVIFGLKRFKAREVVPVHLAVIRLGAPWSKAFWPLGEIAQMGIDSSFAHLVSS